MFLCRDLICAAFIVGLLLTSARTAFADFPTWVAEQALPDGRRGPLDDADDDDVSNLLEYVHRFDPMVADADRLPDQVMTVDGLTHTFRCAKDATDVEWCLSSQRT